MRLALPIVMTAIICCAGCPKKAEESAPTDASVTSPSTETPASRADVRLMAEPSDPKWKETKGMYAVFETTMGKIVCRLFPEKAPKTVANFVELAQGKKDWINPKSGEKMKNRPLYDGVIFHRVIPNFMIQGGDPLGTGAGGPGYEFEDEFDSQLRFDRPGLLAMANAGPGTNGSQFFITVSEPEHLNDRHTIFGQVVEGYEVVEAISKVKTATGDRPAKEVVIKNIEIKEVN